MGMPPRQPIDSIEVSQIVLGDDLYIAGVLLKVCSINPEYELKINNGSCQ
jgi:hypothetical protein